MLDVNHWACMDASGPADGDQVEEAARSGTPGSLLRDFLAANYVRLHRRLARHLGCPDLAAECLHDTWLRLGELTIFTPVRIPEAYVYRTACNVAMDRIRGNRSWQYTDNADADIDHLADPGPGPDVIAEARSELAAVERALHRLPHRHRSVLAALRIEEMTREDVAIRCDLSLRRVDTVLRQALDHCAEIAGRSATGGADRLRPSRTTRSTASNLPG